MAARTPSRRRSQRARRRNTASDFGARVWVAIPAAAYAIAIIYLGDAVFAAGVLLLGFICLHELFRLYDRVQPVRLAGFLGLIGLAAAAHFGEVQQVLLATVAVFPLVFLVALILPEQHAVPADAGDVHHLPRGLLDRARARPRDPAARAPARRRHHRRHPRRDVPGRHGRLSGRAHVRDATARAADLAQQDRRGAAVRGRSARSWPSGAPVSTRTGSGGWDAILLGVVVGVAAPIGDLFESKIKRDAGTKDTGTLFGAHGGALDRLDAALFTLVAGYYLWMHSYDRDDQHVETGPDDRSRDERKRDRQMMELLNELRVALPGRPDPVRLPPDRAVLRALRPS